MTLHKCLTGITFEMYKKVRKARRKVGSTMYANGPITRCAERTCRCLVNTIATIHDQPEGRVKGWFYDDDETVKVLRRVKGSGRTWVLVEATDEEGKTTTGWMRSSHLWSETVSMTRGE